jgi:CubicO group peptidase (beta-lactamase class C family)
MPFLKLLLPLLFPVVVFGQEVISGKVLNEKGEPLAFTSVRFTNNNAGTFTNEKGLFRLTWNSKTNKDSLVFSFIGYEEQRIAARSQENVVVKMNPATATLETVTVVNITALDLVKRAVSKIPGNYWQSPHITHGFYRVHTQKGDEHLMLSEAVFDIFNPGYSSSRNNQFKLIQMRSIQDEKGSHGIDLGLKPNGLYKYDVIRELENSDLLNKSGLKNHTFRFLKRTTLNGQAVHQVAFDQKDGLKESLYKGILYIDVETDAIIGLKLGRSPKGMAYAKYGSAAERALLKVMGMQIDIGRDDLSVEYQSVAGKWMLARVQNDNTLRFKSKGRNYDFTADVRVDYIVTGFDTATVSSFSAKETLGSNRFIESQQQKSSAGFWKDYNILLADYNAEEIAAAIEARNENNRLKNQLLAKWKKLPRPPAERIDSILNYYYRNDLFNGSILICQKGQTVLAKGYGLSGIGDQLNDVHTQFRIGSTSKTFTALLVMQLVQENKCKLSDTIGTWLKGYVHGQITLEQLLSHSSGIPSYSRSSEALAGMVQRPYPLNELIEQFGRDSLEFEPGSAFRYSNTGYLLLAAIAEKITGTSWKQALEERIFKPLQMQETSFADTAINSRGYWLGSPETLYPLENMAGAGGISSTVTDLEKWAQAVSQHTLLSASLTDTMLAPRFAYTDWDAWYGYGWMKDEKAFAASKSQAIWYHPGTDVGYYSMFVIIPETQTYIILLNNHGDFPRYDITDLLLKALKE